VEDVLRPLGVVVIVFGFLLVALGVAQSMHAVPPGQLPDRWLESVGGVFMLAGIGLTAIAGRSGEPSIISTTVRSPADAADSALSFKITKTTKTIGVDPAGMIPMALSHLVDASSKALLTGMLADLNDPSKSSTIHIEGADAAQVKEELRKLLSPDKPAEAGEAAASSTTETPPDASLDVATGKLRELDDLHAAGVLNDDQYQAARAKLLG
jgi:hypothetical protein